MGMLGRHARAACWHSHHLRSASKAPRAHRKSLLVVACAAACCHDCAAPDGVTAPARARCVTTFRRFLAGRIYQAALVTALPAQLRSFLFRGGAVLERGDDAWPVELLLAHGHASRS